MNPETFAADSRFGGRMHVLMGGIPLSAENKASGTPTPDRIAVVKVELKAAEEGTGDCSGNSCNFPQSVSDQPREIKVEEAGIDISSSVVCESQHAWDRYLTGNNVIIKKEEDLGVYEEVVEAPNNDHISHNQDCFDNKSLQSATVNSETNVRCRLEVGANSSVESQTCFYSKTSFSDIPSSGLFPPEFRSGYSAEAAHLGIKLEKCSSSEPESYSSPPNDLATASVALEDLFPKTGCSERPFEKLIKVESVFSCENSGYRSEIVAHCTGRLVSHSQDQSSYDNVCESEGDGKNHFVVHGTENPMSCEHCGDKYETEEYFKEHAVVSSQKDLIFCEQCGYACRTKVHLDEHLVVHSQGKPNPCERSSHVFKTANSPKTHSLIHSKQQFSHGQCKTKAQLNKRTVSHSPEKLFACRQCDAKFKEDSQLKLHLVTHIGYKPYSCASCPAKLQTLNAFQHHLSVHNAMTQFPCTICPSKFKDSASLRVHLAKHTNESPYPCPQCSAKFKRAHYLRNHLTKHHHDEPFLCPLCPAKLKSKDMLRLHVVNHAREKLALSRSSCSSKIKSKSKLNVHQTAQDSEKELFSCSFCSAEFRTAADLQHHIETSNANSIK